MNLLAELQTFSSPVEGRLQVASGARTGGSVTTFWGMGSGEGSQRLKDLLALFAHG